MDTTGQRATQKINIKLLLSEPTKNKFPKSFLLLLVCVCVGGWWRCWWEREGLLMEMNTAWREEQFSLLAATRSAPRGAASHMPGTRSPPELRLGIQLSAAREAAALRRAGQRWPTSTEKRASPRPWGKDSSGQEHPMWVQSC